MTWRLCLCSNRTIIIIISSSSSISKRHAARDGFDVSGCSCGVRNFVSTSRSSQCLYFSDAYRTNRYVRLTVLIRTREGKPISVLCYVFFFTRLPFFKLAEWSTSPKVYQMLGPRLNVKKSVWPLTDPSLNFWGSKVESFVSFGWNLFSHCSPGAIDFTRFRRPALCDLDLWTPWPSQCHVDLATICVDVVSNCSILSLI